MTSSDYRKWLLCEVKYSLDYAERQLLGTAQDDAKTRRTKKSKRASKKPV